ncbi:hypothetical protein NDK50_35305 [Paraburkholderia bryophila]|uniref:hypothetical protein n=1 Tax=Paraburkholderia bryophila TaxID=420952 RepID=UPI00234A137C|nr:hypothetical protein [Paraburkholderia bryophila]WCM23219.1 hypothetical protein NDK50_35305 [Paraburkholderia bryophila]
MWVRVAATALAVWCVSGAAVAAGYAETWNPPEATGHAAKQAGKTKKVGKVKASGGSKVGSKASSKAGAKGAASKTASKTASRHTASAQHGAQRVASGSASVPGKGGKPATHGAVKKVTARNGSAKGAVKALGTTGSKPGKSSKPKAAVMAQGKKPHAQRVTARPAQGKVTHANLVQGHATDPLAAKVAAKPAATKPAVAQANAPAQNANVSASPAPMTATSSNPATASSGSLPPILH